MNNETDIGIKFSASVNGNKKLQELAASLSTIKNVADGLNTGAIDSIEVGANETKKIAKNTSTMANTMKLAFNFATVRMFARTLGNVTKELTRLANKSSEYLENVNLFQVAFDGNYRSAERFINKISEMYGLDESRITRVVGIFKQLSNAMNVSAETGERLATLMTQMSLDISSLYNVDFERATSVLQSAISGQTKPIRGTTGADITQSTLQTTLDNLGIDRAVNQLTFAEKRLLIIISLTEQLKEATNDLGRTIESPANQLKVLSEQWQRLSRALGNTFLPILAKILPYLNAILMVLTEIISMIAKLFGYKEEDYDYFSGTSDAVMDLEDSLGKATAGVGKLKKALSGLRNFDKLNVISTPASGGAGGGAGSGLGGNIDPSILKAFNNAFDSYQDKLENVRMKASKIRDSIMEWLGFTKELDPMTGKIVWKYKGFMTTLKNIWKWFKELSITGKVLVGVFTALVGSKIISGISKLFGFLGNTKIGIALKTMVEQMFKMQAYTKALSEFTGSKFKGFLGGVDLWKETASKAERVQTALGGLITTAAGLTSVKLAMDSINESGLKVSNTMGLLAGQFSSTFGGAMAGAAIGGGWGAVIGGVAGAISGLITAIWNYETESEKMVRHSKENLKDVQKTTSELKKEIADTNMEIASQMSMTNYHEKLVDELETIIDKNGKIKSGYEDRAKYITGELSKTYGVEYELENGVYKEVDKTNEEIRKRIKLKEQEILLEAYKEDYIEALKKENELYATIGKKQDKRNEFYDEQNEKLAKLSEFYGIETIKLEELVAIDKKVRDGKKLTKEEEEKWSLASIIGAEKAIQSAKNYDKAVETATQNYKTNKEIEMKYSNLQTAVETGNIEEIQKATDAYTNSYIENNKTKTFSDEESMNKRAEDRKLELANQKKNYKEQYEAYKQNLTDMSNYLENKASPEMVEQWVALGKLSSKDFVAALSTMDEGIQKDIIEQMYSNGYDISEELQKGLDAFPISKKIKMDVDAKKVDDWLKNNKLGQSIAKLIPNFKITTNAEGGLPPVGQLFVANEKGPELVGQIGGQSFVANQNQIVDFLQKEAGNVKGSKKSTQIYNIYLDANHKIGTYTLEQLEGMAKTNGKPIQIG